MANLTNMLEPLRAWWEGATPPTRAAAVGLSVLVLVGLIFAASMAASPDYTPIFHGVSGKDAAAVEAALHDHNIPMQFDDKSGTVSVPSKDESEATMAVAAANILDKDKDSNAAPAGITNSPFTDPAQQQQQTLANNEARVSQILDGLGPVNSSQVIIAPGDSHEMFQDNVPPTASITLDLKQGQSLSDDQINGVVNLVVMSYTGLTAKSISIVDQSGNPLWDPKSGAATLGSDKGAKADHDAAETMKKTLQDALAVFGPQNTRVIVTAELDRDETHIHQVQNTAGPAISQHTKSETLAGGANPGIGGAAGAASNTGPTTYGGASGGQSGAYKSTDETVNSVPNVVDTTINKGEGGVKSLSAAVLVNTTVPASALPAIQQTVATTIGARPGDSSRLYTVQQVPFDTSAQKAQMAEMKSLASQQLWGSIAKVLAVSVAGCILLFILTRSGGRRESGPQLALAGGGANIGLLEGASDQELENILEERPLRIEDVLAEMPDVDIEPARRSRRRAHAPSIEEQQDLKLESIQDMIGNHPESVALLMKGWMAE